MSIHIMTKQEHRVPTPKLLHHPRGRKPRKELKPVNLTTKRTIVLYSPDMDFCVSLRMLFQDHYNIVTTTEPDIMTMMVKSFKPDLVIVDSLPTDRMQQRFSRMRKEHPSVRIMVFYASSLESTYHHEHIRQMVDALFSKPLDLAEVIRRVHDFASIAN